MRVFLLSFSTALLLASAAQAQIIETVAGGVPGPAPALSVGLGVPAGVAGSRCSLKKPMPKCWQFSYLVRDAAVTGLTRSKAITGCSVGAVVQANIERATAETMTFTALACSFDLFSSWRLPGRE